MLAVSVTKVRPDGSTSLTWTLVAESGPLLARLMVKVISSPTLGAALLTVLVIARSALCGVTGALSMLFVVSESNWSRWVMLTMFSWELGLTTVAVILNVAVPPLATLPTVHSPVLLL